jgi:hypothetical protein
MKIDVPLKRPEFKRDEMGRFERRGAELIKKPEKTSKHLLSDAVIALVVPVQVALQAQRIKQR